MTMTGVRLGLTLCAVVILARPATGFAQADVATATLTGTVTDPSGGVVPRATVTVTSIDRNSVRAGTTDERGAFRIALLEPGFHAVRIQAPGFSGYDVQAIELLVGQVAVLDATLAVGGVESTIVVSAPAQVLDARRTQQADTVVRRQIDMLPNVQREFRSYVLLLPGVTNPEDTRAQNPGFSWVTYGFGVGGTDGRRNLLTIDGGEFEHGDGTIRTGLNVEAIQEFQVNRNAFAAEFGFTAGAAVNIVTRSGSNRLAGSAYSYFRSEALAARNYFDHLPKEARDRFIAPGGSLGGPIRTDRAFFFAAYEGWKGDRARYKPFLESPEIYGPTSSAVASIGLREQERYLQLLAGSGNPNLQRIATSLRQALTTTSFPGTMRMLTENNGTLTAGDRRNNLVTKVDLKGGDRDSVTLRYSTQVAHTDFSFVADEPRLAPSNRTNGRNVDHAVLGSWSRVIGPAALNQLRAQFAYSQTDLLPASPDSTTLTIDGLGVFGRASTSPFLTHQKRMQFEDVFSVQRGAHTLKAGGSYRPVDYNIRAEFWFGGSWTFSSGVYPLLLAAAPQDQPALAFFNATTVDPATGRPFPVTGPALGALTGIQSFNLGLPLLFLQGFNNPEWKGWAHYAGFFAQDSWRVGPRVTLDYGMRYDVDAEPAPLTTHGYASPRAGVAWTPTGSQRTVVRGGAGLFYAPIGYQVPLLGALLDDSGRYVNQVLTTPLSGAHAPAAIWARGAALGKLPARSLSESDLNAMGVVTGRGNPGRVIFDVDPAYRNPYTIQSNAGITQQLAGSLVIDAAYLMYLGRNLPLSQETNYRESGVVDPVFGPQYVAIDPTIVQRNTARSIGSSSYHAMALSVTRRFERGVELQANYTLSRAIDDTSGVESGVSAFLPTRLDRERGRSAFDVPHVFVARGVVQTPAGSTAIRRVFGNFSIAPVVTARSGVPFTLRAGRDVNGDTHSTYDRPFLADRNTGRGAPFVSVDLRISRRVALLPRRGLTGEVILEGSNLLNRTNFIAVNDVVGADPQFVYGPFDRGGREGVPATTPLGFTVAAPGRQMQVGFRATF